LKAYVGDYYPSVPPKFKFCTKINMAGVNQTTGEVDPNYFFKNWKNNTIEDALKLIRKEMESSQFKKLKQPEEFTTFN
jgi:ubiquitin-conjugating enzyme E2 variant